MYDGVLVIAIDGKIEELPGAGVRVILNRIENVLAQNWVNSHV